MKSTAPIGGAENSPQSVKRVALVGIGGIARKVYLPLLSGHPRAEIVGVVSRSESSVREAAARYRIPNASTELGDLLRWEPDAVFVHSATAAHYEIVTKCLEAGLPVYADKPLSTDPGESAAMAAKAEKKGLLLAAGFNRRFAPLYVEAKAWIEEAGGFAQVHAAKHRTSPQNASARDTVYDDLIHMLDLLLWLSGGDSRLLSNTLDTDRERRMLGAFGALRLGGAAGSYAMTRSAGRDSERLELHGSGRTAVVDDLERAVFTAAGGRPEERGFGGWDTVLKRRGFEGVVEHFLDCLDDPQRCTVRADLVLGSHELAERAARSF
ncbi:Gfo/Idh/MocA family oxidoreductase [Saccharibacillus sp. CPCC 101409]|uniref:Gfo/Idh/MocA family protein n=1 Tax=Saccharibacillus sp. CPCC 101409 TaxID=3058041 RepID=UPI0026726006|nr:Gfo/Idh/MocA family oxidoreductase [Saccharibacillus sp. CPCC 101409]MDO3409501.1 Gfo/Idh/MocA family oxidoreductase [Saccharibacillus sp. CPCC 101409]